MLFFWLTVFFIYAKMWGWKGSLAYLGLSVVYLLIWSSMNDEKKAKENQ